MFILGGRGWKKGCKSVWDPGAVDRLGCLTALRPQELQGLRLMCCHKGCSAAHLSLLLSGFLPTAPAQNTNKGRIQ